MKYDYRYSPNTQDCEITCDGVGTGKHMSPGPALVRRLTDLRNSVPVTMVTVEPKYFRQDGTAVYQRTQKERR